MDDLIAALTIFRKYTDKKYPTGCEHDTLYVYGVPLEDVSAEDVARLDELGFEWDEDIGAFYSFRFGSA